MKSNLAPSLGLTIALSTSLFSSALSAQESQDKEAIRALEERIIELEKTLDERLNAVADAIDTQETSTKENRVHIGGYGELNYNNLDANGEDIRELNLRRMVLFFGYDFSNWARFVTELEVENAFVSASSRGAVEVEQAYIELDLKENIHLKTGVMLMPIGIISETHEPPTFYGVERPIIETTIIPTTWFGAGMGLAHNFESGFSYDVMITEGFKTDDPNSDPAADPFDLKAGKQKASFADAFDFAVTGRVRYRGASGLEVAAYTQYQPDIDQSAEISYAESATLIGGHAIYQIGDFTTKALYARWDLAGNDAKAAGKDIQDGGYLELAWRPTQKWGFFARQSAWSQEVDIDAEQTNFGVNFYPLPDIVFKADIQTQNDDAGKTDGFNLGMGYQF